MKKLFNSRFLFILAISIVVLIILTLGAFYLFDDEDDVFVKSGYVLNPLSSTAEKYFFDEAVGYKENLSSMIEFKDVDENTVTVLKDSFIHYLDESMSFLKNGAILDLDSVKGDKAVSFYNITDKSIIEKRDSGYVIESASGDINLKNFIGRISDNKYIVVGDLSLKMAGNSTSIKGDYFEIVYVEEGIVNIENKSVKYQVTADNTFIYVGSDKVIDLGEKKITVNDEDVMSITAITIDGNENIEIIPKGNEDEDEQPSGGDGTGSQTGDSNVGGTQDGSQTGEQTGGDSTGGTGNDNVDSEDTEEVVVSLKDAEIGSTNIDVVFDVVNAQEDDVFMLQVVNLSSGRTVDMVAQVLTDIEIQVNLLTPNTKYLFMVINEKDNGKYFQKVLETTGFGIKLEKSYATDRSLAYKVIIEEGTDITNAKLALYKFNEETKQNEIVTTDYVDSVTGEVTTVEKVTYLSNMGANIEGEYEIIYDGLDSNTIYTAVLDEFSLASVNFKDIYNVTLTSMTLKKVPAFSEMTVTKDVGAGSFDLSLGNINDPDNAIVGYTYMIYDKLDDSMAIDPIVHNNASPITVKVGDGENELRNDTNYYYKVIIEYFDNEKYIEYVTTDSIIFMMGNEPYVTVVPNDELISYDKLGATIYLTDNSCLVSMPGRERCSGTSSTVVEVSRVNALTGERTPVYTKLVTFDVSVEEIKYDLVVENLEPGTTYSIEVRANFNNSDNLEKQEISHTDESKRTITTKSLASFDVEWENMVPDETHIIYTNSQFFAVENTGSVSSEDSINSIDRIVLRLYEGRSVGNLETKLPIATKTLQSSDTFNIKEKFYDNAYPITSDGTFGLSKQALLDISASGKLSEYYTISIEAYTANDSEVTLINNVYAYYVPIYLREVLTAPVLEIDPISNNVAGKIFTNLTNDGTSVGYKITAAFDLAELKASNYTPQRINFYVYNTSVESREKVKFYIKDENGELQLVDKLTAELGTEDNFYEATIYMDYGTSYDVVDDIMRRGNSFYIGYDLECKDEVYGNTVYLPVIEGSESPTGYGIYDLVESQKETPSVKMYIATTDSDSVTYSYNIEDPDNAIYKDAESENYSFYATVNEGEEIKFDLVKLPDTEYNQFEGRITVDNLKNGDFYKLYYKMNPTKTGDFNRDVLNYLDGYGSGIRMFDGYYDAVANSKEYNFAYQVINNPLRDNKVTIKILANENILDRILSYRITFNDSKGNVLNKELWQLTSCDGDKEGDIARCLSVDYTDLMVAGMKSENNETNAIKVTVTALYDNGLTGYDYKVGTADDADYRYCIMQDNSSEFGLGNYISFSSSGLQVTVWSEELGAPKGYYTYTRNNSILYYRSQLKTGSPLSISINLSSSGYSSRYGFLNPKMVSVDEMSCSGTGASGECNTFSFNSITPKVSVSEKAPLINGSVMNFTLSGIDINDIAMDEDGERYLYVETWETQSAAENGNTDNVVRPVVKVKIDSSNPTATVSGIIDGLKEYSGNVSNPTGTYYFNVYAKMYKNANDIVYTQLFDAGISSGYDVKSYELKTAKASDIFHSMTASYSSSDEIYGNRSLNTKINLLAYKNNIAYNFDIIYVMCEVDDVKNCGPEEGNTNIFKKVISVNDIATIINDSVDISEYDLEFDKEYYIYIYTSSDYYAPSDDGSKVTDDNIIKRNVLLNRMTSNSKIKLKKLTEPSFVVTRNASIDNGDYIVDFDIVVSDADRTLVNGNYYIQLLDSNGSLVGNMKLQDNEGNYYDVPNYSEYAFDAFVVSKKVRITGLEPDTKYTFVVYNDAYLNNYSEDTLPGKEHRTYEVRKSYTIYSTNDYGVAFGKDITYSATERSIIVTFLGGSNFENVTEVNYTVGLWDDEDNASTVSGTFVIGENNKRFELYRGTEDWRFVIDPVNMKNVLGKTYEVNISFKVKIPGTDNYIVLTSADIPGFEGKAIYVEDE